MLLFRISCFEFRIYRNMDLKKVDAKVFKLIEEERLRQQETLMMIPSENYASEAVLEAMGSVLTNKYSEGYPNRRYYQGNQCIDEIECLAIDRVKQLFDVPHANVQPYSGSVMNAAVYMALLNYGDKLMGMKLRDGGHLTHGHPKITFSGKFFESVQYEVNAASGEIDYDEVASLVKKEKPKLLVCGFTAYPRLVDFAKFGKIAESVDAWLVADISHIAGLVVGKMHPSPVKYADVVTTTTHKTLRGPRGGVIMVTHKGLRRDRELGDKIDKAVFPGLQGGPHNNLTAAKAVCFEEAGKAGFKIYARRMVQNSNVLGDKLTELGWKLVTGGTDTHLLLADMSVFNVNGKVAAVALEVAGIVVNFNTIPGDPASPMAPNGIRLGTPALTTRGMGIKEMRQIGDWMHVVVEVIRDREDRLEGLYQIKRLREIAGEVRKMAKGFPVPGME